MKREGRKVKRKEEGEEGRIVRREGRRGGRKEGEEVRKEKRGTRKKR